MFPDDRTSCTGEMLLGLRGDAGYNLHCYGQPASSDTWHRIVAIFDRSASAEREVRLYIDGVAQEPTSRPLAADNSGPFGTAPLHVFSRGGTLEHNAGRSTSS